MKLIDLTHPFTGTMPVYPGDTAPQLVLTASAEQQELIHSQLSTSMHVGTHIDAPLHFIPGGARMSDLPVERFFGPGVLLDARGVNPIDIDALNKITLTPGCIVIIYTGWAENYAEENYFVEYPEITTPCAEALARAGVSMVGIDTPSPDRPPFDVHKVLLGNNVLIIENLTNLNNLPSDRPFEVIALPLRIDAEGSLARVVARA